MKSNNLLCFRTKIVPSDGKIGDGTSKLVIFHYSVRLSGRLISKRFDIDPTDFLTEIVPVRQTFGVRVL